MKLDRTIVAHIDAKTEEEFLGLVELERLRGDDSITNSSLLKKIVTEYINTRRTEYLLLSSVFKEN